MKKFTFLATLLASAGIVPALGATLTFGPIEPSYGPTTSDFGIGFTLSNDTDYLVVTAIALTGVPGATLPDAFILDPANFAVVGPAPFGTPVLHQDFDSTLRTGIGYVRVDTALLSPVNPIEPILTLTYDLYGVSPNDPAFDPSTAFLSGGNTVSAQLSLLGPGAAPNPVPEPASLLITGSALITVGSYRKFSRRMRSVP